MSLDLTLYQRIDKEWLTKPVGELEVWQSLIIEQVLKGPYGASLMDDISVAAEGERG